MLREGSARIDELARTLDVSAMTVHRDLDALAQQGWFTKIRGGATANPSALVEAGVRDRAAALHAEKMAIGAAAATLLRSGQTIFIDDSTTALTLVPHLGDHAPITVATNFLPVITDLSGIPGVDAILLGGQYFPLQEACFGLQTAEAIRALRADLLFTSTTAVNQRACYDRSEITVLVKRAFMACAQRKVLLVDHAKFGRPSPHLLCAIDDFDLVVTDDSIDSEDLAELKLLAVEVTVAER